MPRPATAVAAGVGRVPLPVAATGFATTALARFGVGLGSDGFAAADDAADEVGAPDVGRHPDVATDAHAARDDRPLADDRDAGVQPAGLLLVRAVREGPVADERALARPRPPCRGSSGRRRRPERMTESNMTIESRTTAPTPTRTPGDSTELTTVPSMTQPWLIRLRWTWAVGPTLAGRPFLGPGVDDPVLVVEVELRVVGQERHVGLPVRLDGPDVLPVAVVVVAEDPGAGLDHRRDDVATEVDAVLAAASGAGPSSRRRRRPSTRGRSWAAWASPATR